MFDLSAVPFDPEALQVTGGQVFLVEGIFRENVAAPQFAVSDSGTMIYFPAPAASAAALAQRTLVWVNRDGKEEPLSAQPNAYQLPRISPDGTKIALVANTGDNEDIWIWDIARKTLTRLTFDEGEDSGPLWTPDGKRIAFYSIRKGAQGDIYWKAADGTGEVENVGSVPNKWITPWSWSGDGNAIIAIGLGFGGRGAGIDADIGSMSMEGKHEWNPLLKEKYWEIEPRISPDGRWMAYQSSETGRGEIYVRPFPDVNKGRWQVSTSGGNSPLWSPNGRELFYCGGDAVMVVAVRTEPTFSLETPKVLFRGTYFYTKLFYPDIMHWDISPDGKRFLMIKELGPTGKPVTAQTPRRINIVLNWTEELKRRVPAGKK